MLEEIKTFVTVVGAGSFTKAAEELGISRSVISKKLSALEANLGVRLLNRTTRRLSLTEAGGQFYQNCRNGLNSIDEAVGEVRSLSSEPRGRLLVNLPLSFGVLHIAPLIAEFLQRFPGIQVDLNFEDRKVEMIDPGFDVSIRIADMDDSSLVARRLATCRHLVVASPDYVEKYGMPDSPDSLRTAAHHIASYRMQDSALEWQFKSEEGDIASVKLVAEIIVNNSLALKEIVLAGAGLARMPSFIVGPDVVEGKLVNLFPELNTLTKSIYAVFPKREYMPSKTRVFIDFLAEKISDPPQWDSGL